MSRIDQLGRVAFLCVLMINLSLVAFYQAGCARVQTAMAEANLVMYAARASHGCACPDEELPDPIPQELQNLFDAQESIYTQLFQLTATQPYRWCYGVGWQLSDEVTEGPADPWTPIVIMGKTWEDDDLWIEVYDVHRWTDFSECELTQAQQEWVDEHELAIGAMGLVATGPLGSVEVWGLTQAITHPTLGRIINFTPLVEAAVVPPAIPSQSQCPNAPPGCVENAKGCLDLCLERALEDLLLELGLLIAADLVGYLACIASKPYLGPSAMAVCGLLGIIFNAAAIIHALASWGLARNRCYEDYHTNMTNCCNGLMVNPCQ